MSLENDKRMLRLSLKHHTCVSVSNLIVTFFNKVDMNDHISKVKDTFEGICAPLSCKTTKH